MKAHVIAALSVFLCAAAAGSARAAAPAAPDGLRKERLNAEQVRITWIDHSEGEDAEDGFEILRRVWPAIEFETRGTVAANVTEFVDEAPRGSVFIYQVLAFNGDGDSALSNQCFVNRNPPAVPSYFHPYPLSLTIARVSWLDVSYDERGFEIQRALPGKRFRTIARVPANTEFYDDDTLDPATTYTYRMRTLGRPGVCWDSSKFTVERTVTTKGGVRILQVELRGRGSGTVTSIPERISCGPHDDHCTAEFPLERYVTLIAKPAGNSRFAGWADFPKCQGSKDPCTFRLGEDRVIGAVFRLK